MVIAQRTAISTCTAVAKRPSRPASCQQTAVGTVVPGPVIYAQRPAPAWRHRSLSVARRHARPRVCRQADDRPANAVAPSALWPPRDQSAARRYLPLTAAAARGVTHVFHANPNAEITSDSGERGHSRCSFAAAASGFSSTSNLCPPESSGQKAADEFLSPPL